MYVYHDRISHKILCSALNGNKILLPKQVRRKGKIIQIQQVSLVYKQAQLSNTDARRPWCQAYNEMEAMALPSSWYYLVFAQSSWGINPARWAVACQEELLTLVQVSGGTVSEYDKELDHSFLSCRQISWQQCSALKVDYVLYARKNGRHFTQTLFLDTDFVLMFWLSCAL